MLTGTNSVSANAVALIHRPVPSCGMRGSDAWSIWLPPTTAPGHVFRRDHEIST
jgi:hypothetical protein